MKIQLNMKNGENFGNRPWFLDTKPQPTGETVCGSLESRYDPHSMYKRAYDEACGTNL